jgi:DNA-binding NarL/FixJ family response regulator
LILALLAAALTTAEIGERLKLGPRTVEAHLRTLSARSTCARAPRPRATRSNTE